PPSLASSLPSTPEGPLYSNVLTPDKIPDFFIPPKLTTVPPEAEGSKNLLKAASRHIIQIESADEWASEEDFSTNADPQAQTAMSLPYVPKAQTSYGFATLMESPHTRRKESLFHSEHGSLCQSQATSPSSQRKAVDSQAKVIKLKHSVARNSSLSTDDSSADTSPSSQRRMRCATPPAGAAGGAPPQSLLPLDSPDRLHKEHTIRLSKGGSMRLTAEYDAANARLRVRVIAAEQLFDKLCDARAINCCVSLCLNPGKVQKQRSTIIKNSRNPVFNEDFFFDCLGAGNVKKMALKVKVVNKGSSLKRDTLLGERELPLTSLLPFL
uniref:C2 domain-containing protein n=1 Tax=Terrapene triunguis TaxID=2587831 RepID=A0A674IXP0_9SAUR